VNLPGRQIFRAADIVHVVRIAAVDDDVSRFKQKRKIGNCRVDTKSRSEVLPTAFSLANSLTGPGELL
jgi:hypothetical protein